MQFRQRQRNITAVTRERTKRTKYRHNGDKPKNFRFGSIPGFTHGHGAVVVICDLPSPVMVERHAPGEDLVLLGAHDRGRHAVWDAQEHFFGEGIALAQFGGFAGYQPAKRTASVKLGMAGGVGNQGVHITRRRPQNSFGGDHGGVRLKELYLCSSHTFNPTPVNTPRLAASRWFLARGGWKILPCRRNPTCS